MEGEKGFPAAAGARNTAVDPVPSSPPLDEHPTPVGCPEDASAEIDPLPSDEDHDLEPEAEPEPEPELDPSAGVEDLKRKIIKQVEYYFSDENLPTDNYLMSMIKKNKEGFVPIGVIASFRKMKKLTRDFTFIVTALRESSLLVVSSDGKKVKRLHPLRFTELHSYTVVVENLPEDHSTENIRRIFGKVGNVKNIRICDPHAGGESKGSRAEMPLSGKLHALVQYETVEAAEKAAATLNNEQDWRNGLRVKLLKKKGKFAKRRQAWKGSDAEKNITGKSYDEMGEEENCNLTEYHDDTPEEADGDHSSKEKNGHRGRNWGRSRKHRYHGTNGHGHGTTTSAHAVEISKPPPGPRMPDGTRGFTMGRGRPPVSI